MNPYHNRMDAFNLQPMYMWNNLVHPVVSLKPGSPTLCWLVALGQAIFTCIKIFMGEAYNQKWWLSQIH